MSLNTTIGGASANSFATLVEIKALIVVYHKILYYKLVVENLQAVEDDVLEEVAKIATANLTGLNYMGSAQTTTQALSWPRTDQTLSQLYRDIIPSELKQAQVLEMAELMNGPVSVNSEAEDDIVAGIKSKSMGQRATTYTKAVAVGLKTNVSRLALEVLDRANLLSNNVRMPRG